MREPWGWVGEGVRWVRAEARAVGEERSVEGGKVGEPVVERPRDLGGMARAVEGREMAWAS